MMTYNVAWPPMQVAGSVRVAGEGMGGTGRRLETLWLETLQLDAVNTVGTAALAHGKLSRIGLYFLEAIIGGDRFSGGWWQAVVGYTIGWIREPNRNKF